MQALTLKLESFDCIWEQDLSETIEIKWGYDFNPTGLVSTQEEEEIARVCKEGERSREEIEKETICLQAEDRDLRRNQTHQPYFLKIYRL